MKLQLKKSIFLQNFNSVFRSIPYAALIAENAVNRFHKIDHSCGRSTAIAHCKSVSRHMKLNFLSQEPVFDHSKLWTKTRNNIPTFLYEGCSIKSDLQQEPQFQQAVLTACQYYMIYNAEVDDDTSTITTPSIVDLDSTSVTDLIEDIGLYADTFFKERKVPPFQISDDLPIYCTTKAGAHGAHAMSVNGLKDLMALKYQSILDKLIAFIPLVYSEQSVNKFTDLIERSFSIAQTLEYKKDLSARIYQFPDGGGKTRTICIPDIWTQSLLKPIHEFLMKEVIRRMPCDGTFSHPNAAMRVRKKTKHEGLYCFDLTAVTDRLPVKLQVRVLTSLLGTELAHAWKSIIVDRDFYFNGKTIRYAVGQPMGMLSSWSAMAITHHIIVNYCKRDKSFYTIIGDDMVMSSKVASEKYRSICGLLGIEINESKSITPKTVNNKCGEIAKRIFSSGSEISPIPPKVLVQATEDLSGFLEFIRVFATRTHSPTGSLHLDIPTVIDYLFTNSKIYYNKSAHILLSNPILWKHFDILPNLPPLTGIRLCWIGGMPERTFINDLDQFLLERANNKIIDYSMKRGMIPGLPKKSRDGEDLQTGVTPLLHDFMNSTFEELKKVINLHGTTYETGEDDSFAISPPQLVDRIYSYPDPFDTRDFRTKRVQRERRTLELITEYWTKSRFSDRKISFPVKE